MKIYERFRFAIFDCDETLIRTESSYSNHKCLALRGLVMISKQIPLVVLGKLESGITELLRFIGIEVRYFLYPDVYKTLDTLRKEKVLLFVSSASAQKMLIRKINSCAMSSYFSCVLGAPKGTQHVKYFGDFFLPKYNFLEKTFFVGDGLNDMRIAKECGLYAIGITNSHSAAKLKEAGADVVINDIGELLELEF